MYAVWNHGIIFSCSNNLVMYHSYSLRPENYLRFKSNQFHRTIFLIVFMLLHIVFYCMLSIQYDMVVSKRNEKWKNKSDIANLKIVQFMVQFVIEKDAWMYSGVHNSTYRPFYFCKFNDCVAIMFLVILFSSYAWCHS